MSNFVEVPPQSTGEKISVVQLPDGSGNNVDLQRIIQSDPVSFGKDARSAPRLTYSAVAQASTNADLIKSGSTILYGFDIFNNSGEPLFLKFYNSSSQPVAGSGTPIARIGVQAGERAESQIDFGLDLFSSGLGLVVVKGASDSDATPTAIDDFVLNVYFL